MTIATGERLLATDITDLTFFPKGTILTFSSEAWSTTSAAFKTIWKICNGQNGTPDLRNKFLRGGESSNFTTPGGADSQSIEVPLKSHSHTFTGNTATGSFMPITRAGIASSGAAKGVFTTSDPSPYNRGADWYGGESDHQTVNFSMTPTGIISTVGEGNPNVTVNTVPKYYTVIYIMKVA